MIHLIGLIDKGIHSRLRHMLPAENKKWTRIYGYLEPFKMILVVIYLALSVFEKPQWCLKKLTKAMKEDNVFPSDNNYAQWLIDTNNSECNQPKRIGGNNDNSNEPAYIREITTIPGIYTSWEIDSLSWHWSVSCEIFILLCMAGLMIIKNKAKILDQNSKRSTKILWGMTILSLGHLFVVVIYNLFDPQT